jgi:hypothetical protein
MYLSKLLLRLLVETFVAAGQIVDIVVDETLERRRGRKIDFRGWYRDPVRSTQSKTVTASGVRWLCFCILVSVPWSTRRWALPFCTIPANSAKNCVKRGRLHRGSVGLTVDGAIKIRQWLGPSRPIRLVGDSGFTAIDLLHHCNDQRIEQIGRIRLNAGFYDLPGEQPADKRGVKPSKGERQLRLDQRLTDPSTQWTTTEVAWYGGASKTIEMATGTALWYVRGNAPARLRWVLVRRIDETAKGKAAAFFSSNTDAVPDQIVACYAQRWNIEVFFEEVRACLGFETQRGWCKSTICRTTPCLFGIFSLVVVMAKRLFPHELPVRQSAWYTKDEATFRDALSAVREHIWQHNIMFDRQNNKGGSHETPDMSLIPTAIFTAMREIACYAA